MILRKTGSFRKIWKTLPI